MSASDEPRTFVVKLQTLAWAAMPDLGHEALEQLVAEQITRAVPSEWRLRILDAEVTTTEGLIRRIERIKTTEALQKEMVGQNQQEVPVRSLSTNKVGPEKRSCFKCGRRGHLAAACRLTSGQNSTEPTCFRCGGRGHIQRQCPSPQAGPGSSGARPRENKAVRRVEGLSQPVEAKAVIELNGTELQAVVDTGSATSIISQEVAEDLGLEVMDTEDSFIAANGTSVSACGRCQVSLKVGEITVPHCFVVAENLTDCALVGMDVLQQLDAIIDCRTGDLVVGGTKVRRQTSVRTRRTILCAPRSETFMSIRRVSSAGNQRVFYPAEVEGVVLAPTIHLSHQAVPIRLLNLSDSEVVVPAGTVVGDDEPVICAPDPCRSVEKTATLPDVSHLPQPDREKFLQVLQQHQDVFSSGPEEVGKYTGPHQLVIDTGGSRPIKQRAYQTPLHLRQQLQDQLNHLQDQGLIEQSASSWASPVVMVKKKDGGMRLCCDYRAVNQVIKHDSYPLPRMEDLLEATEGSNIFTVLDQRSAYWAIPVEEKSREVTAFTTEFGLHQWTRQPFGLKTSPATFQRIMEDLLKGMNWKRVMIYLDDVILFSKTTEEHLRDLEELLQKFQDGGLMLNPGKCRIAVKEVDFLGHHLSTEGIRPAEEKVEALRRWPSPKSVKDLRRVLGFIGYYQQYIPAFGSKTAVMSDLLKKDTVFNWTPECEKAFQLLKQEMEEYPLLKFPDVNEEFVLTTDGSGTGWGAVLSQEKGVIAFASGKWTPAEKNWSVTERELGAIIKAVTKFRHYLIGKPFKLRTDHEAIQFLQKSKPPSGKLYRWLEKLQEYDFTVEHVRGSSIPHVDALSRQDEQVECCSKLKNQLKKHEEQSGEQKKDQIKKPGRQPESREENSQKHSEDLAKLREKSKLNVLAAEFVPQRSSKPKLMLRKVTKTEHAGQVDGSDDEVDVETESGITADGTVEFREATANDPVLRKLCQYLEGKELETENLTEDEVKELKFYCSLGGLHMHSGIILRKSQGYEKPQVLVPQSMRAKLLQIAHEVPTAVHGGVRRTAHRLMEHYFWYNLRLDVRRMCSSCHSCLAHKSKTTASQEGRGTVPVEGQPLQQWAADILELPKTKDGYRYVLVITDMFSKLVELFALRTQTAEDVADCLTQVVSRYGVMKSLLTDQGRNFESGLVKELCKRMKIKKLRTTVYRPCCNGVTERFNRTLCEMRTGPNGFPWLHLPIIPVFTQLQDSLRSSSYTGSHPGPCSAPSSMEDRCSGAATSATWTLYRDDWPTFIRGCLSVSDRNKAAGLTRRTRVPSRQVTPCGVETSALREASRASYSRSSRGPTQSSYVDHQITC